MRSGTLRIFKCSSDSTEEPLLAYVKYTTDHVQATTHGPHAVMESSECDPKQNMYLQL